MQVLRIVILRTAPPALVESGESLLAILNDIVDLSKVEAAERSELGRGRSDATA